MEPTIKDQAQISNDQHCLLFLKVDRAHCKKQFKIYSKSELIL